MRLETMLVSSGSIHWSRTSSLGNSGRPAGPDTAVGIGFCFDPLSVGLTSLQRLTPPRTPLPLGFRDPRDRRRRVRRYRPFFPKALFPRARNHASAWSDHLRGTNLIHNVEGHMVMEGNIRMYLEGCDTQPQIYTFKLRTSDV